MKEVSGLRQMVEDMKKTVAGLRFEDKEASTGSRVTTTGVNQDREDAAENLRTEEMNTDIEDEEESRTEEKKEKCSGTSIMTTDAYTSNPESIVGKEIYLRQWDILVFNGEHVENEHWWIVEDGNGQVGYAPMAFLVVITYTTVEEGNSDATKKGHSGVAGGGQGGHAPPLLVSIIL